MRTHKRFWCAALGLTAASILVVSPAVATDDPPVQPISAVFSGGVVGPIGGATCSNGLTTRTWTISGRVSGAPPGSGLNGTMLMKLLTTQSATSPIAASGSVLMSHPRSEVRGRLILTGADRRGSLSLSGMMRATRVSGTGVVSLRFVLPIGMTFSEPDYAVQGTIGSTALAGPGLEVVGVCH